MIVWQKFWLFTIDDGKLNYLIFLFVCFVFVSLCLGWPLLPDIYLFNYPSFFSFISFFLFYLSFVVLNFGIIIMMKCWCCFKFFHCPSLTSSALCRGIILLLYFLSWIKKKLKLNFKASRVIKYIFVNLKSYASLYFQMKFLVICQS